jgi:flagellar motor switch protein FliG
MNPQRLRQIAILVDSLETAAVDRLLEQLPDQQQQAVRNAVMALNHVDPAERQRVLAEFRQGFTAIPHAPAMATSAAASAARAGAATIATRQPAATYGPPSRGATPSATADWPAPRTRGDMATESTSAAPPGGGRWPARGSASTAELAETANPRRLGVRPADHGGAIGSQATPVGSDLVETLESLDLESLAGVVLRESPAVLAVVLALLSPLKSAQLLELCPADLQAAALSRLRELDELDDEVVNFLQQELYAVARQRRKLRGQQRVGPAALAEILVAAQKIHNPSVTQTLHAQLREPIADSMPWSTTSHGLPPARPMPRSSATPSDSTVSENRPAVTQHSEERLASPDANHVAALADVEIRLNFADFVDCDTPSLQAVLATAKPMLTLLALKGAAPRLLDRVLKMLPRQEANEVQFRIQNLGPTRVQDIQQAQTYLLRLASLLEDAGRFRRPTRRRAG